MDVMDDKTFLMWLAGYLTLPQFDREMSERLLAMAKHMPDGTQVAPKMFSDTPSFWRPRERTKDTTESAP